MKTARFGVRLFTAWWLVEFVTGFSAEWHAISARKRAKQRQARAGQPPSTATVDFADLAPAQQWTSPVSPTALDGHLVHSSIN